MKFNEIFQSACNLLDAQSAYFITTGTDTFLKIGPRSLMDTCMKVESEVVLTAFSNNGKSKVADFYVIDNGEERNLTFIFLKA